MCDKCSWGEGITIKPDGNHILDPCIYKDTTIYYNATVIISKCIKCGHVEISWTAQNNTEKIILDQDNENIN